ncbi:hypothetical protein BD779DRAFT_1675460 [Infundibulicybe gibba]|nr:hypothetical protein BD779DRAFT_1675460 [Infundibulicybe gibba]
MATTLPAPIVDDVYAHHGRNLIEALSPYSDGESALHSAAPLLESRRLLTKLSAQPTDTLAATPEVGILGAGIGGLYTALILQSVGISYKIIEQSDRAGGRLFTHRFKDGGAFDYFDVGAMRFPSTPVMSRLFHLFKYQPLNHGEYNLVSHLIPFHSTPEKRNGLMYFTNIREQKRDDKYSGNFLWSELGVEREYVEATVEAIKRDVVQPYTDEMMKDLTTPGRTVGWEKLRKLDAYSLRTYMSAKYIPSPHLRIPMKHLPAAVVDWCEMLGASGTGTFNRSFPEVVLGEMNHTPVGTESTGSTGWKCLRGGSQVLSDTIERYLRAEGGKIQMKSRVASISFDKDRGTVDVGIRQEGNTGIALESFEDVISTLPPPCLRMLNLQKSGISVAQANALRQITYGPAVKIGMRFNSAWWTTMNDISCGQSFTDRPVRNIVYPSYGDGKSNTLIVSFCRMEDAQRFGVLTGTGKQEFEDLIKEMVIRDLALIHDVSEDFLNSQYKEHFAWNWHHPWFPGAYATFAPGLFEEPYRHLNLPAADGHLHFAGEALSVRHAWVVGALDSAWRAVKEVIVMKYGTSSAKYKDFMSLWGENLEWRARGQGNELGRDLLLRHLHLSVPELFTAQTEFTISFIRIYDDTVTHGDAPFGQTRAYRLVFVLYDISCKIFDHEAIRLNS